MPYSQDAPHLRENLTREEARARAATVSDVVTRVHLALDRGAEVFGSETHLSFTATGSGDTFVDLTARSVEHLELDGQQLPGIATEPTRVWLRDLQPGPHVLRVVSTMAYQHEGRGLHRFVDPSDDDVYLHSQFQPFDAHLVFACFDQPDLKTIFELSVDAPADWVVVSNGARLEGPEPGLAGRWRFAPTPAISPYITAVVAGAYDSVHDVFERPDGTTTELGLYVRRSLAPHLDPDEVFEVTRQGLTAFEAAFGRHYPFGKYDQLFVPEFSAGAMENPGCITFSETYVFRSKVTDALRERRADTILHEMAHMWFGDLVTMRWWDDLWLNESFAAFMSVLVQATSTRWHDAWVTFLDAEKSWARLQDQLPSTHPVADEMADVESVHQNFDGITYAKGAAVLRQLVAWVGQDAFLTGCRDYFDRHAWGNTELGDFLSALERASARDLAAWRDEWLLTTGVNVLTPRFEVDVDGTYTAFSIEQGSPAPPWADLPGIVPPAPVLRRHRLAVGLYDLGPDGLERTRRVELDIHGARTEVAELVGATAADVVLVNDDDLTYAKISLDPTTTSVVERELARFTDPLPRTLVWASMWDMVRDGQLPASRFADLVIEHVDAEDRIGVLQRLLTRAVAAAEHYGDPANRAAALSRLADHGRASLRRAGPGSDHQLAWARHWASVARTEPHIGELRAVLDGEVVIEGLAVDADLRWHLVTCLARTGSIDGAMIDQELEADGTDLGARQAATARAAMPTTAAKQTAWRRLLDDDTLSHTMSRQVWTGFNQLSQPDLLAPYVEHYFDVLDTVWATRSLDWAIAFSTAMFPHPATGPMLLGRVDDELAQGELPRPLRRVLLEQRDTLVRAIAARECDRAAT